MKPLCSDHLCNIICYLWFIQQCVLMETEDTNSLLLTISAFWSSSRWPMATKMSSRRQRSIPLSGPYRQVSLYTGSLSVVTTSVNGKQEPPLTIFLIGHLYRPEKLKFSCCVFSAVKSDTINHHGGETLCVCARIQVGRGRAHKHKAISPILPLVSD